MAQTFFILALIIQSALVYANIDDNEEEILTREILQEIPEIDDEVVKDSQKAKVDWMDMFLLPNSNLYPISSAALMSQATNSDKSPEEQLKDIKELANKITLAIQSEMANLLSYALVNCDKERDSEKDVDKDDDNKFRKKRSIETPMDSTQLVMRLLRHIKCNNEYQNIAIEKMMTAQQIADKYGIDFQPDSEILSDLAVAANEQAKDLTTILKDACDGRKSNRDQVKTSPVKSCVPDNLDNGTFYVYSIHPPQHVHQDFFSEQAYPPFEYVPDRVQRTPARNHIQTENFHMHFSPCESQIMPTPHHCHPVTPKPTFYDSVMPYTPSHEIPFYLEPVTTTTTIILPIDEVVEPEPELVGEEYEETISSKIFVNRDEEPGTATVNHVTTYTLSEKAHFKTPQIEKLPQQMQYTFFLL